MTVEKVLKELEDLHLIKVLKRNVQAKQKLSEKYSGKLPPNVVEDLHNYVSQSREEWENRIS